MKLGNFASFMVVLLLFSLANSATLYVNASGNCGPYSNGSTIQEGIDAASTGDTVIVCKNGSSGYTPSSNVRLNKSITLNGNESYVLINNPLVDEASAGDSILFVTSPSNISNLTIIGNTSLSGISLFSTSGVTVSNVNITNSSLGIAMTLSSNNTVSNSFFSGNNNASSIFFGSNNTITNSDFSGSVQNSIVISGSNNNTVSFSSFSDGSGYGFSLNGGSYNDISWNNITNNSGGGFFLQQSSNFNNLSNNNMSNNSGNGFYLFNSHNNTITSNTLGRNVQSGLYLTQDSSDNNISQNSIGDIQQVGITIQSCSCSGNRIFSNTIENHSTGTASGIFIGQVGTINHIYDNSQINNNTIGIYISGTNNTNITNNTISNSQTSIFLSSASNITIVDLSVAGSQYGHNFSGSSNNILANSTLHSNTQAGVYLDSTSVNNTITNNTIYNHTNGVASGIYVLGTISQNDIFNNPNISANTYGIRLANAGYVNATNNTIYNGSYGIYLSGANYSNFTLNTIYDLANSAAYLSGSSNNNTFTNNTAYNSRGEDNDDGVFTISGSSSTGNSFLDNKAHSSPSNVAGFSLSSIVTSFSGNNITNTGTGIEVLDAKLNFSGNNIVNGPSTYALLAFPMSSPASINTLNYNVTNQNLSFGASLENASLIITNLSSLSGFTTISSLLDSQGSSISTFSNQLVESAQGNNFALNVSNLSATASFTPTMYYNGSSKPTLFDGSNIGIGSTSSAGIWTFYSSTDNTTANSLVPTSAVTSFSYFAPIFYISSSLTADDDSSSSKDTINLDYQLDQTTGELTITTNPDLVNLLVISTSGSFYSQSKISEDNKAIFTLPSSGVYKILATKQGYTSTTKNNILLDLGAPDPLPTSKCIDNSECLNSQYCSDEGKCEQLVGTCGYAQDHEWVNYECCSNVDCGSNSECSNNSCVEVNQDDLYNQAKTAIENAELEIENAQDNGKIVSQAQTRLQRAKDEFENGNYELAIELATQSLDLIKDAESIPKDAESEAEIDEKLDLFNYWWACLILLVISVILFLLFRKKKKKKEK